MKKVKVGIVGLGRLGKKYAEDLVYRVHQAEVLAACSLQEEERTYAKEKLGIPYVFTKYEDMLALEEIDTFFVVSPTTFHVAHIIQALEAGKHVFSEKPLGIELSRCLEVERVAKKYPKLICMVGFVRRFDPSYVYAKEKIEKGLIGKPFLVKSQTVDLDETAGFQMEFVKTSGGMFHDYNVHDIDLARWYLGSEVKQVFSTGGAFKYPEFAEVNDADNVLSTCVFEDGSMAQLIASRTAAHGHDTYTEIVGTEGILRIGRPSASTRVQIMDRHGARYECVSTFYDRFKDAFLLMTQEFISYILENKAPKLTLRDATQATRVASAMTESLFLGKGLVQLEAIAPD
ncbi:MAG: Gfo/Idh/MocA family oxidoreductase [Bacteroidota bacterium]